MKRFARVHFLYLLAIAIGTGIYAFGFVAFNMANHLAQGGGRRTFFDFLCFMAY